MSMQNDFTNELYKICENFSICGEILHVEKLTSGNINKTFKISILNDTIIEEYIIQEINDYIFKRPDLVMENITNVTKHLKNRMIKDNTFSERKVLNFLESKEGKSYYLSEDGKFWRSYNFIDNSITYNTTSDLKIIEEAGKAFGSFQFYLNDFDAKLLHISITEFHNTLKRLNELESSFNNATNRIKSITEREFDFIMQRKNLILKFNENFGNNKKWLKVTHNDTKCNNVLFDKTTKESLTVIDLDTVMSGLIAFDYGDAIRSIAATCDEDETNLDNININLDKFEAFTKGYLLKTVFSLSSDEIDSLNEGIVLMTIELASRFLKDYIDGNKYFKVLYPQHNLDRAKCQIELIKQFEKRQLQICNIIEKYKNTH